MRESIFYSSLRAFCIVLFGMLGLCISLALIAALLGILSETTNEPDRHYSQEVVANAEGSRKILSKDSPVVLKLNISGVIGVPELNSTSIQRQLIESREGDLKKNRVKALLLHINSPGGTVVDSAAIYHAIKQYKNTYNIPVYAYIDGMCASGGMYIACAADQIFASEESLIGSVGVLSPNFFNFHQVMEKYGINALTLTAGKGKDELNPFRVWKEGEGENVRELINFYYHQFIDIVTKNRPKIDKNKLIDDYGAQVFNAPKAEKYGYINVAGISYKDTLKKLLHQIGIEDDYYQVVELKNKNWYSTLFSSQFDFSNQFLYLYNPN